jgi:iron-sulfur cluster repair protein YtfE (RIC family)
MTNSTWFDARLAGTDAILARVAELAPGDELLIRLPGDTATLRKALLDAHPGHYDFSPLHSEAEGAGLHVAARGRPGPRSVTAYLAWDHDRLDALIEQALAHAREGRWPEAAAQLEIFRHGLFRHADLEDAVLFPAFEERSGLHHGGPTEVMRREHLEIKEAVNRMLKAARARDPDALQQWHANLLGVLVEHNMKEEEILYPGTDQLLDEAARETLVERLLLG